MFDAFRQHAESLIDEAIRKGDWDDTTVGGKPSDGIAYLTTPEDQRLTGTILKNSGHAPVELELIAERDQLRALEQRTPAQTQRLIELETTINLALESR